MEPKLGQRGDRTEYVFIAPHPGHRLIVAALVLSLGGVCVGATRAVSDREPWTIILAVVSVGGLLVCWAMLQASIPQRITLHGAIVQIRRKGRVDRFDLEDPAVDIRVRDGEIAFAHYMDRWVVVRARDVDWHVFSDVVMYYQNHADRNAEERDARFNR